jgi:hypothetical protein
VNQPRRGDDRGTGVLGSAIGVFGLVLCLMLSVQVASHLVAMSRLRADVANVARATASDPRSGQSALADARARHGNASINVSRTGSTITVTARRPSPATWLGAGDFLTVGDITAVAHASVEQDAP